MTDDLPRRIEEHYSGRSGSPTTRKYGVAEIVETLPASTREEAFVIERATVLRYLQQGQCIATGGGINEEKAVRARDEHNLLKQGFHIRRKRSLWVRPPRRQKAPLEVRKRLRHEKKMKRLKLQSLQQDTPGA